MMRLLIAFTLASLGSTAVADPIGVWRTPVGGQVAVERCGAGLCGRLLSSPQIAANPNVLDSQNRETGLRDRKLKGLQILSGFSGGPDSWTGGQIYNPQDGKTYSGSIVLTTRDSLILRGCVVAPFCRSQTWARVR